MSGPGFVILAHARLDRAAALARHLSVQGAPVVVHLDRRVPGSARTAFQRDAGERIGVIAEHAAEWGRMGMVDASLAGARALLAAHPGVGHIQLLSGACLPLRPVEELAGYLARHPNADFIESVPAGAHAWVQDGLSEERFTLYHPFSHRHRPGLFSASVDLQRRLRVRRRLPDGLVPHLGRQWWCLSAATVRAILDHPRLDAWRRWFRQSWIPDESFFQTLIRHLRPDGSVLAPLHFSRFNPRGRPHVFHDDHVGLLGTSDHFFARKADPDADALYGHFLTARAPRSTAFAGQIDPAPFDQADARTRDEGRGMLNPARLPKGLALARADTARPYLVLVGEDAGLLGRLSDWIGKTAPDLALYGRLFTPDVAPDLSVAGRTDWGNLSRDPVIRDHRPAQFLARVVWTERARHLAFVLGPGDDVVIRVQLSIDPNARLILLVPPDEAAQRIERLRAPLAPDPKAWRRPPRRARVPFVRQSWYTAIDPAALAADLEGQGSGGALADTAAALLGDLDDPSGWSVP